MRTYAALTFHIEVVLQSEHLQARLKLESWAANGETASPPTFKNLKERR